MVSFFFNYFIIYTITLGGSSEIKLDSDDEGEEKSNNGTNAEPDEASEETKKATPQIPVSEALTAKTKVSAPSLKADEVN